MDASASMDHPLCVFISVFGRFHAYHLARELEIRGALQRLFTSYPYRIEGVRQEHLWNPWYLKVGEALATRYLSRVVERSSISEHVVSYFDRRVSRYLHHVELGGGVYIFHGFASHCRSALKVARGIGCVTFVDSACPHPRFKRDVLTEEAELVGSKFVYSPAWIETVSEELESADAIVVPSRYSYRSFVDLGYSAEKLVIVPLGVDVKEIDGVPDAGDGRRSQFRIVMVGSDPLRKGAVYLLRAWQQLRLKDAELIIRCDVPASVRPLLAQPGVRFVPYCSRQEVLGLYKDASVFCFPSVDDGFGLVVLEAMASGLPVIVSEHVGAADLVTEGKDGFIVPIRDVDSLCERILYLYENREVAMEMGRNARTTAEHYDWSRYGDEMVASYLRRWRDIGISSSS